MTHQPDNRDTHTEREVIVTNNGGGGSGPLVTVIAIIVLLVVGFFAVQAFTGGDGEGAELDVNIENPVDDTGGGGGEG